MRKHYKNIILDWAAETKPKPLLLWGARQVGKTTLMREFGDKYFVEEGRQVLYLNFETNKELSSLFKDSLAPEQLVRNLNLYFEKTVDPRTTLFIFDEIQECDDALNSLKYFAEDDQRYLLMAAGSLLGVKHSKKGFPVGKVQFLDIHPLSFSEFLDMTSHHQLAAYLSDYSGNTEIPAAIHEKLLKRVQEYMWTGGMPEVVAAFAANPVDFVKLRELQNQIIRAYQLDFAKHAPPTQVAKISEVFSQIPLQIAKENKKFQAAAISKSARLREYGEAIQWLVDAGIVYKVANISQVDVPLAAHANQDVFKLFLLDVGLLGAMLDAPSRLVLSHEALFADYRGALAENYVLQQLIANHYRQIYYWTSKGTAEIDFIVQYEGKIYPLEVKSGSNVRSKSLRVFGELYPQTQLSRCSALNFRRDGHFVNFPLYGLTKFP